MTTAQEASNKAFVLEAFDTLFNKKDLAAAERFWSPGYIQHSAHIAPGRDGLFSLVRTLPGTLKYENQLTKKFARQSIIRPMWAATSPVDVSSRCRTAGNRVAPTRSSPRHPPATATKSDPVPNAS